MNECVFLTVAHRGYADVLQWTFESTAAADRHINLGPDWCAAAANLEVLQVLRDHGCPWSAMTCAHYWRFRK